MNSEDLTASAWATLTAESDPATYGTLISALAERLDIASDEATRTIDDAIDAGTLVVGDDSGAFTTWTTPDQGGETKADAATTDDPKPIEARTSAAFADAIDWFHQQLDRRIADHLESGTHPDRATTARTYFEDVRGWDAETVADKQLGYAPADGSGLLNHLMDQGYDRDAILGTGLFTESLRPLWQGRYVFPYFDSDGCPVYAISRVTGGEGGGAQGYGGHPADGMSGKYAKPAHTKAYAHIDEPIYGTETIKAGQSVLITEGIADAITAHEAGYACLSPVTTQFKHDDREELLAVLDAHDIPRVYLIQDAERPTSDVDEHGQLSVEQLAPGVKGALATADYLDTHADEATVAIAELPRPGLDKVDLDDYLQAWSNTLAPILASAKPASAHPGYDPQAAALTAARDEREYTVSSADSECSALFDIDIRDVTGLAWDDRTTNPLGHHGQSENYFLLIERSGVGYDHKYKVAYNALTYLVCAAGERRADSPNGRLDDEEILAAWGHAKQERLIPDDDPIPHRALVAIAIGEGLCDRDEIEDGWKLPREAYNAAIALVEEKHGVTPGRDPLTGDDDPVGDDGGEIDPTESDVVIDPKRAWHAARAVGPGDLDAEHAAVDEPREIDLETTDEGWKCPQCGEPVDVVRAAAIERGHCRDCQDPLDDAAYSDAYQRARREFGAPLPEYVDARLATERWDLIQGALEQLTHRHLDSIQSDVVSTGGDDPDVIGVIDPCWTDSASGERIIAFRNGPFYCREHERVLDPVRFVALEEGLLDDCDGELAGETFRDAYQRTRERGAPIPRWICGSPDHAAVLPPAEELVGDFTTEKERLDEARADVEAGYRECATDAETMHVRTDDPALGKTTSAVKTAREIPTLYVAPRKELQQEVEEKAEKYGVSSMILPVFGGGGDDPMVTRGKHLVYEEGQDLLTDRETLHERVTDESDGAEGDDDTTATQSDESGHMDRLQATEEANREAEKQNDEEEIVLDRAQCPTASGAHGSAWQLVVHVARELGFSPADIHQGANDLFGEPLPCQCDEYDEERTRCPYSRAWEEVSDPDLPIDLLIGSYGHTHVASARTFYERVDDRTEVSPRTIAIDEFPGDAFGRSFGGEALDHAVWLAGVLTDNVDTRRDVLDADLWDDDWVRAWLRGDGDEHPASAAADAHLTVAEAWLDVQDAVERVRYSATDIADDTLDRLADADPRTDTDAISEAHTAVKDAWGGPADRTGRQLLDALRGYFGAISAIDGEVGAVEHGFDGAIGALVDRAMRACQNDDIGRGVITSARQALAGGEEGCRVVAVESDDPYAHPVAYLLLYAAIAEADPDETKHRIATNEFSWDRKRNGTTVTRSEFDGATILLDDNHKGAYIHDPPAFTARDGSRNPVVGLDATGREELWSLVLGGVVETANVHETARERRAFLRDVFNVQVVQTTPDMQFYEGSTGSKNFSADIELVREIAREYGDKRIRADRLESTGKPGVLTTKCVREEIEPQLADDTSAFDNYGNVTGSNELAGCRLGAVLGTQHFGHAPVEKWAALAGEEVTTTGHGNALDYHSEIANAFLGHMTEDQTMQAILRFGRDEGGALVFAHTSALREELPVTADGAVVTAHSATAQDVRDAMRPYLRKRASFNVSDLLEDEAVDCSRRSVQRILAEFTELGYLRRHDPGAGRANTFTAMDDPGLGQASLPTVEAPSGTDEVPDGSHTSVYYTGSVGVHDDDRPSTRPSPAPTTTLPAPEEAAAGPPPE